MLKKKTVTVSLDAKLYAQLEYIASFEGRNRARQARQAIRQHIYKFEKKHGKILLE